MARDPNLSILQARGVGIRKRAEGLSSQTTQPAIRDQIAMVDAAARDSLAWLAEPLFDDLRERLRVIDESLQAQAKRLDELEDLLGTRAAAAGRKV
jgi:hypothetical protein